MRSNAFLYEIGRWVAVIAGLVILLVLFGGNSVSGADPQEVAQAVTDVIDMENMQLADNQMVKRFYGLDPADYEGCVLYYPNTNMMAEEVLIVKLKDISQQQTVSDAIETRLQTQKNTFEGYGVEQFDLLTNHAVVELRGNYVLFVVSDHAEAARKAFRGAL